MQKIRKCVIPAAWMWTRFLPATKALPKEMFPIIDKPIMQMLVEEAIAAWCTEIIIVTWRSKRAIEDHFDSNFELEERLDKSWKFDYLKTVKGLNNMANIVYVRQPYPRWDWDAVLKAKNLIWDEPFLVLFWDDIIDSEIPAAKQLVDIYEEKKSVVICSFKVPEDSVSNYWIMETDDINDDIFQVKNFIEKPKKDQTKSRNWAIWKYILTPDIFDYLEKSKSSVWDWEIRLADAFRLMLKDKNIYWARVKWTRYDTWNKIWYLKACINFALKRDDLKEDLKDFIKWLNLN